MLKALVLALVCVSCNAGGLGGYRGGRGSSLSLGGGGSYGGGYGGGLSFGGVASSGGPIIAAVQTRRTVEVVPVNLPQDPVQPQVIQVPSDELPVTFLFTSRSSPVHIQQQHTPGAAGQVEQTSSEEEPHRLVHEVIRPVIQEVREVIRPFRRVVQKIEPVVEQIHTVVAQGQQRNLGSSSVGGVLSTGGASVGRGSGLGLGGLSSGLGGGLSLSGGSSYGGSSSSYKAASA